MPQLHKAAKTFTNLVASHLNSFLFAAYKTGLQMTAIRKMVERVANV